MRNVSQRILTGGTHHLERPTKALLQMVREIHSYPFLITSSILISWVFAMMGKCASSMNHGFPLISTGVEFDVVWLLQANHQGFASCSRW